MKVLILNFSSNKVNEDSFTPNKIGLTFDTLNYFLGTEMYARIPITKVNFEAQKEIIDSTMEMEE